MAIGVVCGTPSDASTEPDVGSNLWRASRFPGARNQMPPSPTANGLRCSRSSRCPRSGRDGIDLFDCCTNREQQLAVASRGPRRRSCGNGRRLGVRNRIDDVQYPLRRPGYGWRTGIDRRDHRNRREGYDGPAQAPHGGRIQGDSFDNAVAETIIGLYKTEPIRRRGPWKGSMTSNTRR
jgi:hypothetical protein